jgi:hypothetical protein
MSIDGIFNQPVRQHRPVEEKTPVKEPVAAVKNGFPEGDVIDIKAMKAILYLGIRGDVYLPAEEGHAVDTRA